ncbi:MAG: leucine-rich repeat domain-containing protein [Gammaproteobacteria bacterium]|nr:leucine-rich repeat domain-containing protein [Gammaproteobacteria bacterium]
MNRLIPPIVLSTLVLLLFSCSRQFAVTVNNQAVYDPRYQPNSLPVQDADLQGCINLALRQQGLQNPADLTVLSCSNSNVRSLDGIEQYTGLKFLDLADNRITNLQPLAGMSQLNGLSIPNNPLTDISVLLRMGGLTASILSGNQQIPCGQLDALQRKLGENLSRPQSCRGR